MKKIAFILTRLPSPPWTGRKQVLRTAIDSALELDLEVHLFVIGKRIETGIPGCTLIFLERDPIPILFFNLVKAYFTKSSSFNRAFFSSKKALNLLGSYQAEFDMVYLDGIRCADYSKAFNCPWHLDLDDLLSERYIGFYSSQELKNGLTFGFLENEIPSLIKKITLPLIKIVLQRESKLVAMEERYYSEAATSVSLVSQKEAEKLSQTIQRQVHALPMAVKIPSSTDELEDRIISKEIQLGFVGPLSYAPNKEAMMHFCEKIYNDIKQIGEYKVTLHHAGAISADEIQFFQDQGVVCRGYVDSIFDFMSECDAVIAPILSGSGIKTKVLEAIFAKKPLLATETAIEGTGLIPGEHFYQCDRPQDYQAALIQLKQQPDSVDILSEKAFLHAKKSFGYDEVTHRWKNLFTKLINRE